MIERSTSAEPASKEWCVRRSAVRCVCAGVVVGLLWIPSSHFALYERQFELQLSDDFFPALLRSPWLPSLTCVAALLACFVTGVRPTAQAARFCGATLLVTSLAHLLHQRMFFVQGFVTMFWASLWLLWLAGRSAESPRMLTTGASLAQLTCSLIFFGGAVGKWTDAYWSGEALSNLIFVAPTPGFTWLRNALPADRLAEVATWYSRLVVVSETVMAALPLLSPRLSLPALFALLVGMYLASPWTIMEAVAPIFGLCLAGYCLIRKR